MAAVSQPTPRRSVRTVFSSTPDRNWESIAVRARSVGVTGVLGRDASVEAGVRTGEEVGRGSTTTAGSVVPEPQGVLRVRQL